LEEIATGHILIFGQINEVDGTFVLDTGSGGTVIDEKNKNKFKLTTNDTEEKASGVGGSNIEMLTSENNHLKIGDL
jgi:predicted aspartyl protease